MANATMPENLRALPEQEKTMISLSIYNCTKVAGEKGRYCSGSLEWEGIITLFDGRKFNCRGYIASGSYDFRFMVDEWGPIQMPSGLALTAGDDNPSFYPPWARLG